MIPIAANYGINADVLCECITKLEDPKRDLDVETRMTIVRSFRINKPGTKMSDISGGVVGGTIMEGVLRIGDRVEILPWSYPTKSKSEKRIGTMVIQTVTFS